MINYRLTVWKSLRCSDFSFLCFLSSYPFSLFFSFHFYNLSELLPFPPRAHLSFAHYQSRYLLRMTTKPRGHSSCLTPRNFQVPPNNVFRHRRAKTKTQAIPTVPLFLFPAPCKHESDWNAGIPTLEMPMMFVKMWEGGTSLVVQRLAPRGSRGSGFDSWSGNWILHAAAKTQVRQINKHYFSNVRRSCIRHWRLRASVMCIIRKPQALDPISLCKILMSLSKLCFCVLSPRESSRKYYLWGRGREVGLICKGKIWCRL